MALGTNQIIALRFLRDHGGRDSASKAPWQMNRALYSETLTGLVHQGLADRLESGYGKDHQITNEGLRALERAL